jgi:serine protease Do
MINMSHQIKIFFLFISIALLYSCGNNSVSIGEFTDNFYEVKDIKGNAVILKRGNYKVSLLGIQDKQRVEAQLKQWMNDGTLGNRIKVAFDSREIPRRIGNETKMYAYLIDESGKSINGFLLQKKVSIFNRQFVNDSLVAFENYTKIQKKPKPKILTEVELVEKIKKATFQVRTYNGSHNLIGTGSGFFIDSLGTAVSNFHVFDGGEYWEIVKCWDGKTFPVKKIHHYSENFDFVIFDIDEENVTDNFDYLKISPNTPKQGESIFVYGNPKGLTCTVSKGIVSAIRELKGIEDWIQVDAAISPGSSGGPVANRKGEIVSIATLKRTDCENCNFSMNIKHLKGYIPN